MAVVTFLIGNGFDLACGLKSRYKDTYKGYTGSPSSSNVIKSFKDNIEEDIETWADFEMALARYAQFFKKEKDFLECIIDYKDYLRNYLTQEQNSFFNEQNKQSPFVCELATLLIYFYQDMVENDQRKIENVLKGNGNEVIFQFINFNYTKVFDELKKQAFNLIEQESSVYTDNQVLHIHGTLENNNIVLGVDHKSQVTVQFHPTYDLECAIIKPTLIKECDDKRMPKGIEYIQSSDIICALGLSLGDSDLTWKKTVADWLLNDSKEHHLIFFNYALATKRCLDVSQKIFWEKDGKKALISKLYDENPLQYDENLLQQKEYHKVLERIHVPVDTCFSTFYPKK